MQQRSAQITVPDLSDATTRTEYTMAGDDRGLLTYIGVGRGVVRVDWRAEQAEWIEGASITGHGPLLLRDAAGTVEWDGSAAVPRRAGPGFAAAWLRPQAAVPLVLSTEPPVTFEGWHADGTMAWQVTLDLPGKSAAFVAHLGEVVLIQAHGEHEPVHGWHDGVTIALDAGTGKPRWRHDTPSSRDDLAARRAAVHGDEAALLYGMPPHIDVIGIGDGTLRRRIRLDRTTMNIADTIGFDGDLVWAYRFDAAHDNPGSHMLGTSAGPPSPARCDYQVWDTRHDRGHPVRTHDDLPGLWITEGPARALIPLADGGAQALFLPEPGALEAVWYEGAP